MRTILFLGGWLSPLPISPFTWVPGIIWFAVKALFLFFMIAMVKAIVPRYRYDQLMRLGWKVFLPPSLAWWRSSPPSSSTAVRHGSGKVRMR